MTPVLAAALASLLSFVLFIVVAVCTRLSDKTSAVRSRNAKSRRLQIDEPQGLVEVLVRKACSPCAANLMLRAWHTWHHGLELAGAPTPWPHKRRCGYIAG